MPPTLVVKRKLTARRRLPSYHRAMNDVDIFLLLRLEIPLQLLALRSNGCNSALCADRHTLINALLISVRCCFSNLISPIVHNQTSPPPPTTNSQSLIMRFESMYSRTREIHSRLASAFSFNHVIMSSFVLNDWIV